MIPAEVGLPWEGDRDPATVILDDAPRKYVRINDFSFEALTDTVEDKSILLSADLLAADPPCNVREESGKSGDDHDIFRDRNVADMLELCEDILKPGDNGHVFCSNLQFSK